MATRAEGRFPVVVIGGSAGALEPLQQIARDLPSEFEGAVFIAMHVPRDTFSALPHLIGRQGSLFAVHAIDGAPIAPGRIVIAPPDNHLVLTDGVMRVVNGPLENRSRPSIDVLFRSAAINFGALSCAVLVSGNLDDGVAGLIAIHEAGGKTLVQKPEDATFPDMPRNALKTGAVDQAVPATAIVDAVCEWISNPTETGLREVPALEDERERGAPSVFTCPDCGGTLWEVDDLSMMRFRCRTGHAYTANSMLAAQGDSVENAMWTAIRALEERRDLYVRVAARARRNGDEWTAERLDKKAQEVLNQIQQVRIVIARLPGIAESMG